MKIVINHLRRKILELTDDESNFLIELVLKAGQLVLKIRESNLKISKKDDNSPVTNADMESHNFITKKLKENFPLIPIVSEESKKKRIKENIFFLVDPLDGTKEFISGKNEFTINIALFCNNVPEYGFINVPALQKTYFNNSLWSYCQILNDRIYHIMSRRNNYHFIRKTKKIGYKVELSRSHFDNNTQRFLNLLKIKNQNVSGSSIKICNIADGSSNIYPRFGPTMEWDIAAGHAILKKAGGEIFNIDGTILKYKKKKYKNSSFIALGINEIPNELKKKINLFITNKS